MKKLILRADDLGFSEAVNLGIAKTVKEGLISTVGVMTNMPYTQHGIDLLKNHPVCFGLHTNISVGKPLCDAHLIPSITQSNGEFKTSKEYRSSQEDFVELEEVILEIEAQLEKFIALFGRKPSYLEGHAVASANFFKGMQMVAQRHEIDYFGFSFDEEIPVIFKNKKIYGHMRSMEPNYNPTEALKELVLNGMHDNDVDLFVCHPGFLDEYILTHSSLTIPRTKEVNMLCDEKVKQWLKEQNVTLVTYESLD